MLALLGLILFGSFSQAEDVPAVHPTIGVSIDIRPMEKIGSLKSGMICIPAGSLYWQNLARENDRDIAAKVARAVASDDVAAGRVRMKQWSAYGRVVSASVKLCVPWHGVVGKPKGGGSITVRWAKKGDGPNEPSPEKTYVVTLKFDGRDPRRDPEIITEAIIESGRRFAADSKA